MAIPRNTRACIAYVVGVLATGRRATAVFDYTESKYIQISGDVGPEKVTVHDHERGCSFSGTGRNGSYSVHDYGRGTAVRLDIDGKNFSGHDYGASAPFKGSADGGGAVTLYDYGAGKYFQYKV